MRSFFVWLAATLLCVAACSATAPEIESGDAGFHLPAEQVYLLYVSPSVDPNWQRAVAEGVRQWTEFTDVKIVMLPGPHVCWELNCFAIYEVSFTEVNSLIDGDYIGYTLPWFIFISNALPSYDALQDTVVHEDGHMLGLLHPCVKPCSIYAVMNPSYRGGASHVACLDVGQYYEERPWDDAGPPPMACTDDPGSLDESIDGGPVGDP